jgi:hypothetical protein
MPSSTLPASGKSHHSDGLLALPLVFQSLHCLRRAVAPLQPASNALCSPPKRVVSGQWGSEQRDGACCPPLLQHVGRAQSRRISSWTRCLRETQQRA